MVFRPRTRQLRRAVVVAALGALVVPATAGAATKKTPAITKVTPKTAYVGTKLTITGKNFKRGKAKNSVLFRRDGGKALFVKADVSTTKKLTVVIPKTLEKYMVSKGGAPVATRFRVRVLAAKLTKSFTAAKASPVIAPERIGGDASDGAGVPTAPDGDCDADGILNRVDTDDDNDLLADTLEVALSTDPCNGDTDGDGVDGRLRVPVRARPQQRRLPVAERRIPVPGQAAVPERAVRRTPDIDYDGDGLTRAPTSSASGSTRRGQHTATLTLSPLSYSDGEQYSCPRSAGGQRRPPADDGRRLAYDPRRQLPSAGLTPPATATVNLQVTGHPDQVRRHLYDIDRDTVRLHRAGTKAVARGSDLLRLDARRLTLADDERDEDADGLTNYDETHGPHDRRLVNACYATRSRTRSVRGHRARPTPTATATACATAPTTRTPTTSRTSWSSAATCRRRAVSIAQNNLCKPARRSASLRRQLRERLRPR